MALVFAQSIVEVLRRTLCNNRILFVPAKLNFFSAFDKLIKIVFA